MSKRENYILNEKYRPDTLKGYICNEDIRAKIQEYIDKQDIVHIGIFGSPGSGKTTLAKIIANNIDCDLLYINATDERSMDVMREKVGSFASSGTFKPLKIVILDEATHLLQASQVILLNMMETYSASTRFILTGNYPERLIDPLKSRLQEFELTPPSKRIIAEHLDNILNKEEIEHTIEDIGIIVNKLYPDFRRMINSLQKYTLNGKLVLNESLKSNIDFQNQILDELKKPSNKSITIIRQILADSGIQDYTEMYRFLYDKLSEYSKGNDGAIIIKIEEYKYHSTTRLDQEICIAALFSSILEVNKKQII